MMLVFLFLDLGLWLMLTSFLLGQMVELEWFDFEEGRWYLFPLVSGTPSSSGSPFLKSSSKDSFLSPLAFWFLCLK